MTHQYTATAAAAPSIGTGPGPVAVRPDTTPTPTIPAAIQPSGWRTIRAARPRPSCPSRPSWPLSGPAPVSWRVADVVPMVVASLAVVVAPVAT